MPEGPGERASSPPPAGGAFAGSTLSALVLFHAFLHIVREHERARLEPFDGASVLSSPKLRVLQVIPNLGIGGAERMLVHLTAGLRARGHELSVVSLFSNGHSELDQALARSGVEVHYLGKHLGLDVHMYPRLRRLVASLRPHIVHTHRYVLRYVLPASVGTGARVVHTLHNMASREVDLPGKVVHWMAFHSGVGMVAIGDSVARSARALYLRPPDAIIRHGIPTQAYRLPESDREAARASLGLTSGVVFLSAARLTAQKNIGGLLQAFAEVLRRGVSSDLLVAGEGEEAPRLARLADELGISPHVRFLGVRTDMPQLLAASDVFVLASSWEGTPLALMEAQAAGKPIIATAVGGVAELVVDGIHGVLVPPADTAALSDAMLRLARDARLRRCIGERAAAEAPARFDLSLMAEQYERLYVSKLRAGRHLLW